MQPGSEVLAGLASAFGADILFSDGSLNRPLLAQRAFSAPDAHLANKVPKQQEDEGHTQPSVPAAQQPSAPLEKTAPPSSSGLADLFAEAGQATGNQKKKQKKEKGRFGDGWLPWRGDTAAEKVRRTVFLLALATLLVCLPFLGYRLYEGWYNDYFTKQLAAAKAL